MHPRTLLKRRPSASMIVALVALVTALGGVSYAAVTLPANSVGSAQIQNGAVGNHKLAALSVGYQKIKAGSVGIKRINPTSVQARVGGTCTAGAITAIDTKGKVTCASAPAAEFDTSTSAAVALTSVDSTTSTKPTVKTLNSEPLPGGSSYIGFATPSVEVTSTTGATQHVEVDCTLGLGPAASALVTRAVTVNVNTGNVPAFVSVPLSATAPSSSSSTTGTVACSSVYTGGATAPTVKVSSTLNALQTAGNTTTTVPGS
jgi:hypothetical protein